MVWLEDVLSQRELREYTARLEGSIVMNDDVVVMFRELAQSHWRLREHYETDSEKLQYLGRENASLSQDLATAKAQLVANGLTMMEAGVRIAELERAHKMSDFTLTLTAEQVERITSAPDLGEMIYSLEVRRMPDGHWRLSMLPHDTPMRTPTYYGADLKDYEIADLAYWFKRVRDRHNLPHSAEQS